MEPWIKYIVQENDDNDIEYEYVYEETEEWEQRQLKWRWKRQKKREWWKISLCEWGWICEFRMKNMINVMQWNI